MSVFQQTVEHLLGVASFPKPAAIYLALCEGQAEITGAGYRRIVCGPGDSLWSAPSGTGATANLVAFTFPKPTADWGAVTVVCLFDDEAGGRLLARAALDAPRLVAAGDDPLTFEPGALVLELAL